MDDPCVREIGQVEDMDGYPLTVGVDGGTVTVGRPGMFCQLTPAQAEEFARLFTAASRQAGQQQRRMAGETE